VSVFADLAALAAVLIVLSDYLREIA